MSISPSAGQLPTVPTVQNAGQFSIWPCQLHCSVIVARKAVGELYVSSPHVLNAPEVVAERFIVNWTPL
jgi:hypothetical protein